MAGTKCFLGAAEQFSLLLREHLQINSDSSPLRVKSALNPIFLQSPPGCIFMNLQPGMAGKHVKVGVLMQHRRAGAYGNGGNQTINQFADRLPCCRQRRYSAAASSKSVAKVGITTARASSRRRLARCDSSRAPASTSICTALQMAISLANSSSTREQTGDPEFRRNSIQAEVSTRITPSGWNASRRGRPPSRSLEASEPRRQTPVRLPASAGRS